MPAEGQKRTLSDGKVQIFEDGQWRTISDPAQIQPGGPQDVPTATGYFDADTGKPILYLNQYIGRHVRDARNQYFYLQGSYDINGNLIRVDPIYDAAYTGGVTPTATGGGAGAVETPAERA